MGARSEPMPLSLRMELAAALAQAGISRRRASLTTGMHSQTVRECIDGRRDPQVSTLARLLALTDYELAIVPREPAQKAAGR